MTVRRGRFISCSGRRGARDGRFLDGQVGQRREDAERDRDPPDDVVAAGRVVQPAAQPHAEEAADLVAEEDEAAQHRQVLHAEDLRDHRVGGRHRGQPQQAHHRREHVDAQRRQRHGQEDHDGERAQRIDRRQDVALGHALAQRAGRVGAEHVEQANERQRRRRDVRREPVVLQVAGHVHADEHDLEAAHEVARHEPAEAGIRECFAQRLSHALVRAGRRLVRRLLQAGGERDDGERQAAQREQRLLPAEAADQPVLHRHHEELAERAGRGRHAHGPAALVRRDVAADHAVDDRVGGARLREAEHQACAAGEREARGGERHRHEPQRIQHAAHDQHAPGAEAVGQRPGERAGDAPREVLHREREGEGLARPAAVHRDRLQPQAEAVPDAHRQGHDHGAAQQHLVHRERGRGTGDGGHRTNVANRAVPCSEGSALRSRTQAAAAVEWHATFDPGVDLLLEGRAKSAA
jgi:hypothetical protein